MTPMAMKTQQRPQIMAIPNTPSPNRSFKTMTTSPFFQEAAILPTLRMRINHIAKANEHVHA
jgi:hypothetical protein